MIATTTALLIAGLASGGAQVYGAKKQSSAAKTAAKLSTDSANRAAEIQAQSDAAALDYARQAEATRKTEFEKTQALNLGQYNDRERRLTPYRDLGGQGVSTLATLIRPGSGSNYMPPAAPRTLGSLVGG